MSNVRAKAIVAIAICFAVPLLPQPAYADVPVAEIVDRRPPIARLRSAWSEHRLEPFSLIGVTLPSEPQGVVRVRTVDRGRWSDWVELEFDADGPDGGGAAEPRPGVHSEPVWVGQADGYEIDGTSSDAVTPVVHLARERIRRQLVVRTTAAGAVPHVNLRSAWGARPPKFEPSEADSLEMAIVHHSVSSNSYSAAQVPSMLRSIQAYHQDSRGWNDIGYNFAVDRFGGIWEGYAGGITRAIIGAHAAGFNARSVGVVLLGDHTLSAPTTASTAAVADLIGWRFAVAETDPRGTYDHTAGTNSPKYPPGTTVTVNRVTDHRTVGQTDCPGGFVTPAVMQSIRDQVVSRYSAYAGNVQTRWLKSPTKRFAELSGRALGPSDIAAVGPDGDLEVVVWGGDNRLWRARRSGDAWTGFSPVDSVLRSGPTIVGHPDGSSDVAVRGGDDGVWWATRSAADRWSGWAPLGGLVSAAPDLATNAAGDVTLVARGMNGSIWLRSRPAGGAWAGWETIGGGTPAGSSPAVVAGEDSLDVFVRGNDNSLWTRSRVGGAWGEWKKVGGWLSAGPTAAESGDDVADVVVRGGDQRLWHASRTGGADGSWSGWEQITLGRTGSSGGLTSAAPGGLDLVVEDFFTGGVFHNDRPPSGTW